MNKSTQFLIVLAAASCAIQAMAAPFVVLPNGQRVEGSAIRYLSNGDVNLTTSSGIRTFVKGTYAKAVADKPAEFDQAVAAMNAKRFDDAIRLFSGVIANLRGLEWDVAAARELPKALVGKGDAEEAVKAYDRLFLMSPAEKQNADALWGYRRALLAAKQYPALIRQLDAVAASGSRPDAARAHVMRGDIQSAQNNLDQAVLDYLRTVVLFQDVKDPAIQGEAHFKAAQTLEALRDHRAKEIYQRLVKDYGSSPYAVQAQGKL